MIFQTSFKLDINDRNVHLVFDMDTGAIGFTESTGDEHREYNYLSAPPEFRMAFAEWLDNLNDKTHTTNGKISRKANKL